MIEVMRLPMARRLIHAALERILIPMQPNHAG